MRSETEIREVLALYGEFYGGSYEENAGAEHALRWVLGEDENAPLSRAVVEAYNANVEERQRVLAEQKVKTDRLTEIIGPPKI